MGVGTQARPVDPGPLGEGRLAACLAQGRFVATCEFDPPDAADPEVILRRARPLLAACDAVNVTDGAGGHTHIASLAVGALLAREGGDPVVQMACRDRNRIAIQADALGAAALGVRNLLCMTGDPVAADAAGAKAVFDLDATSLLELLASMRDRGRFASGRELRPPPAFFLGAASNPFGPPHDVEIARLEAKVAAGAQFVQSQFCFDPEPLADFMAAYRAAGLDRRCHYLVGVGPLRSAAAARRMRERIPGVVIPDPIIARLEQADDEEAEGRALCIEVIRRLREIEGVAGVHVMAPGRSHVVPDLLRAAGIEGPGQGDGASPP